MQLHQHKTELIIMYKIVAADSSELKCSGNNSKSSDAVPEIGPAPHQVPGQGVLQII